MAENRYPSIAHLNDLLPAIRSNELREKTFRLWERDSYLVADYSILQDKAFGCLAEGDPADRDFALLCREVRGLKFDLASGRLLARGWPKFFNLNQRAETRLETLPWQEPHQLLEKLDGAMVHAVPDLEGTSYRLMTRGGHINAADSTAFIETCEDTGSYDAFIRDHLDEGITPLFEWLSPENRIILEYVEDSLVLTGLREVVSGRILPHAEICRRAAGYRIPAVRLIASDIGDPRAFVADFALKEGIEGACVLWGDGHLVKLKTHEYLVKQRLVSNLESERAVLTLIFRGCEDDVLPLLMAADRQRLSDYAEEVRRRLTELSAILAIRAAACEAEFNGDRRAFAASLEDLPGLLRGAVFKIASGEEAEAAILSVFMNQQGDAKPAEDIRPLLDQPKWQPILMGAA